MNEVYAQDIVSEKTNRFDGRWECRSVPAATPQRAT